MRLMSVAVVTMVVVVVGKRDAMLDTGVVRRRGLLGTGRMRLAGVAVCGNTFHRDSRERLNREAQREQHDDEEFAPVRHGSGV